MGADRPRGEGARWPWGEQLSAALQNVGWSGLSPAVRQVQWSGLSPALRTVQWWGFSSEGDFRLEPLPKIFAASRGDRQTTMGFSAAGRRGFRPREGAFF